MKTIIGLLGVAATCALLGDAQTYDDEFIRRHLDRACWSRHYEDQAYAHRWLLEKACKGDTNRYLRLVKEVAHSHTNRTWAMICLVGQYGSADDLPFLYDYVPEERVGRAAIGMILEIEGITSNLVEAVGAYFATTNAAYAKDRYRTTEKFLRYLAKSEVAEDVRQRAISMVVDYTRRTPGHIAGLDKNLSTYVTGYRVSTNRLDVLRTALAKGATSFNSFQLNYVTNAIHELELALEAQGQNE